MLKAEVRLAVRRTVPDPIPQEAEKTIPTIILLGLAEEAALPVAEEAVRLAVVAADPTMMQASQVGPAALPAVVEVVVDPMMIPERQKGPAALPAVVEAEAGPTMIQVSQGNPAALPVVEAEAGPTMIQVSQEDLAVLPVVEDPMMTTRVIQAVAAIPDPAVRAAEAEPAAAVVPAAIRRRLNMSPSRCSTVRRI